jgi:mycothiol synthase
VGTGTASWDVVRQGIGEATMQIWVLPEHRAKGIGSALWARLAMFARERGMHHVAARVIADDPSSLRFAEHRGLESAAMQQLGILELDASHAVTTVDGVPGIRVGSIADHPEHHRAVYDHFVTVLPEVPSWGATPVPSFEAWEAMIAEPAYRSDLSLIALDGDAVVGQIDVDDDGERRAFIGMLTVAPGARRRGIARALKEELAHRAAAAGWTALVTVNDGTNDAIRRLNEQLGYRYLPEVVLLHGPLPSA